MNNLYTKCLHGNYIRMSFYVKTAEKGFTRAMSDYLISKGFVEKHSFPVTFLFVQGEHVYYINKINSKRSEWISLL